MAELDYAKVRTYWAGARPSIMGPYMMDGFGFPTGAGHFRFCEELRIVDRLISPLSAGGTLLDLGSGVGYWAESFARRFSRAIAVESSEALYATLCQRCRPLPNVTAIRADVLEYEPGDQFRMIFFGGIRMYLNDDDVHALLHKVVPFLEPGGTILCRETTVRDRGDTRQGDYQAIYRTVEKYTQIFHDCGLRVRQIEANSAYILMQMGCELVRGWKAVVPRRLQLVSVVGRSIYAGLRPTYPWITRVPEACGRAYPELLNHFLVLEVDSPVSVQGRAQAET